MVESAFVVAAPEVLQEEATLAEIHDDWDEQHNVSTNLLGNIALHSSSFFPIHIVPLRSPLTLDHAFGAHIHGVNQARRRNCFVLQRTSTECLKKISRQP